MKVGYLRVSTNDQNVNRQFDGLRDMCDELHIEKISAVSKSRPVYDEVIQKLQPGDTLVVWDLDRAFRSTLDALLEAEKLLSRDVQFQIATLLLDTSTPTGKLLFTVLSAFAEFERRMISKRTIEGLAVARSQGKRLGRPPKLTGEQLKYANRQIESGKACATTLAKQYGVAHWTLIRALRKHGYLNEGTLGSGSRIPP